MMQTSNPWSDLQPAATAMLGRRVDAQHLREWFWCVDPAGRYGLALYGVSGRQLPTDLEEMHGLTASIREQSDGTHFLLLILGSGTDWEMFHALCDDLVDGTRETTNSDDAVDVAITRLRRWQRFLSRGRRPGLTEEEARGLLGELLFLSEELAPRVGIAAAVHGWAGPKGHPQDFALEYKVFEIKSRLSSARHIVEISSAEQLESDAPALFLLVQELAPAHEGTVGAISLNRVVKLLRHIALSAGIEVANHFGELLDQAGYEDGKRYGEVPFLDSGRRYFLIAGDFPRIIRSQVAPEIPRVRYALDVSLCTRYEVKDPWV